MKINNQTKTVHKIGLRKLAIPAALFISALFIISVLLIFASSAVQGATIPTYAFGNSLIGTYSDQNDANGQSVSYFTSANSGSVTDIIAYIDGASSGNAIVALYAVSGGSAGATRTKQFSKHRHYDVMGRFSTALILWRKRGHNLRISDNGQCAAKRCRS